MWQIRDTLIHYSATVELRRLHLFSRNRYHLVVVFVLGMVGSRMELSTAFTFGVLIFHPLLVEPVLGSLVLVAYILDLALSISATGAKELTSFSVIAASFVDGLFA